MESPAPTMSSSTSKMPAIMPCQTMRGHTDWVTGVVHLPSGRRIITCSVDGSLRLWDLESGAQIGDDWRDESEQGMWCMALSLNDKTVASGSHDGTVRLWDVETKKVIVRFTAHTDVVCTLCWSADGERVASGSRDGTARVWDVKSGETILTIKTGHKWLRVVMYSPDNENIATSTGPNGDEDNAIKIWDSKTGRLITTLKHNINYIVRSLAWTSDGKKLIISPSEIFDTATWQQIAVLERHTGYGHAFSLSPNNRLLANSSWDHTARLWNLDTNLQIGPPLQHEDDVRSAAFSADGKVLVTGCENGNAYTWDIHAIIKEAGLEDLLLPISHVPAPKSLVTVRDVFKRDATRRPAIHARRIPPGFFDGAQSSTAGGTNHRSSNDRAPSSSNPHALLERFSSFFRHSHSNTDGATELQQRPRGTIFSRGPRVVEVAAVQDRKALVVAPRPRPQQQSQLHGQTQASSSQTQPAATSTSATPPAPGTHTTTAGAAAAQSPTIPWWARLVLFLCCASPPHANGH